jgi:hypothetical protein
MPKKAVSKAQAKFLGAVAGGAVKKEGLPMHKAQEMMQGVKMSKLPARSKKK